MFKGKETKLYPQDPKMYPSFFQKLAPFLPSKAIFRTTLHQDECNAFHASFEVLFVAQARQINPICTHRLLKRKNDFDSFQKEKVIFSFFKGKSNFALFERELSLLSRAPRRE